MQYLRAIRNFFLLFLKRETVLFCSILLAVLSMFFVPPSAAYFSYIDGRVLCLLFCFLVTVAGLQKCGLFDRLAGRLLNGIKNKRLLSLTLVLLPFFSSMLVTNDVALITFVPFTILILSHTKRPEYRIHLLVLQTVAANLGSMATPFGNPQNLYLFSFYRLSPGRFFSIALPPAFFSLFLLSLAAVLIAVEPKQARSPASDGSALLMNPAGPVSRQIRFHTALFSLLFLLCLLTVFRLLPYPLLTMLVVFCLLLFDRRLLLQADYGLLATFVCFFILAGNLGQLTGVREFLTSVLTKSTLLASALASQFISNVPAAALLSGFTRDAKGLLLGTNIGGLGTPIASLASLITLKFYLRTPSPRPASWFASFLSVNFLFFLLLLVFCDGLI